MATAPERTASGASRLDRYGRRENEREREKWPARWYRTSAPPRRTPMARGGRGAPGKQGRGRKSGRRAASCVGALFLAEGIAMPTDVSLSPEAIRAQAEEIARRRKNGWRLML